ncbi:MAG: flagellar export chaperone FliS [Candidatus Acidiferrales bacterium]
MKDPARAYRESAVRGASPVGLIVILYEEVLRTLRKAQRAIQQKDIEGRTMALSHVLDIVGHLQSTLDFERGGEVASNLSRFYNVVRAKILEANIHSNIEILELLSKEFSLFINTWQQVDSAVTRSAAQSSPNPPLAAASQATEVYQTSGAIDS